MQEWVASLPALESHTDEDDDKAEREDDEDDDEAEEKEDLEDEEQSDSIRLGEEASYFVPGGGRVKNLGQLLLQKNNKNIRSEIV